MRARMYLDPGEWNMVWEGRFEMLVTILHAAPLIPLFPPEWRIHVLVGMVSIITLLHMTVFRNTYSRDPVLQLVEQYKTESLHRRYWGRAGAFLFCAAPIPFVAFLSRFYP